MNSSDQDTIYLGRWTAEDSYRQTKTQASFANEYPSKQKISNTTDLIELLKIQLEVSKNSKQEAIKYALKKNNEQHKLEIQMYQRKIHHLEQQLKRKEGSFQRDRNIIDKKLDRTNSLHSFRKEKKTRDKSRNSPCQNYDKDARLVYESKDSIKMQVMKQYLLKFQEQQTQWFNLWVQLITQQAEQFQIVTNQHEKLTEEAKQLLKGKGKKTQKKIQFQNLQHKKVIIDQQLIIKSLKSVITDLQEIIKTILIKISRRDEQTTQNICCDLNLNISFQKIKEQINNKKDDWKAKLKQSTEDNNQLKSILQGMIKIVKQGKANSKRI